MSSGVYKIINIENNKLYIGSSYDTDRRWKQHLWQLKSGIHANTHLQSSYNIYGINSFKFEILEEVFDTSKLKEREQEWIDKFWDGGINCYNQSKTSSISTKSRKTIFGSSFKNKTQMNIYIPWEWKWILESVARNRAFSENRDISALDLIKECIEQKYNLSKLTEEYSEYKEENE